MLSFTRLLQPPVSGGGQEALELTLGVAEQDPEVLALLIRLRELHLELVTMPADFGEQLLHVGELALEVGMP